MIKLNIKHTGITTSCLETLIEGNVNSVFVEFTFSPEWDNLSRIAVFSNGTSKISVVLSENTCVIPWEMFSCPGNLLIAVRGVGDGGNLVICTKNASLGKVIESLADDDGDTPEDATPSVIDALVADVAELKSGGSGGEHGHTPVKGTDYWTSEDKAEIVYEAEQMMSDTFATKDDLADKADKIALAETARRLRFLAELTKGQAWDVEQGTSPAYQQIVPSGAKAVSVNSIGGHTEVVNGQLVNYSSENVHYANGEDTHDFDTSALTAKYFPTGMKSARNIYDEFDFERMVAIQRVGSVDLGTLSWVKKTAPSSGINYFQATEISHKVARDGDTKPNLVCAIYTAETGNRIASSDAYEYTIGCSAINTNIFVQDTSHLTEQDFKAAMSGVYLYYELGEPIETPITESLDTLFNVEGDSAITFENDQEASVSVPIKTVYAVNLSEVV